MSETIGFLGLGRLGLPIASLLIEAGYPVVCSKRGRSAELVAKGGSIAGDGSARAVAAAASVVVTCLSGETLPGAFEGPDGMLAADGARPLVIEMSTAKLDVKQRFRDELTARGGEMLDCPISGTPPMVEARRSVIYASGDHGAYERVEDILKAMSPGTVYVGGFGHGTKLKYVANLLVFVHALGAAEAMAFADAQGLDLGIVARVISGSPGASSGQFINQSPMMAERRFEGVHTTVAETRDVLAQIIAAAETAGAWVPTLTQAQELFEALGESGADESHPAKLFEFMRERAQSASPGKATDIA